MKRKWRTFAGVVLLIIVGGYLLFNGNISSSSSSGEKFARVDSRPVVLFEDPLEEKDTPHSEEIVNIEKERKPKGKENQVDEAEFAENSNINSIPKSSTLQLAVNDRDQTEIDKVLDNIERCMTITNVNRLAPLEVAKSNAARYVKEYRKVIPTSDRFLDSCRSNHCWEADYSIKKRLDNLQGHIGNVTFDKRMKIFRAQAVDVFRRQFHSSFSSKVICLPKIFLAGFPKCGSSFLWCFMNRVIHQSESVQAEKEPHFWIDAAAFKHFKEPSAPDFSNYVLNFAKGISQIEKDNNCANDNVSLMDGSPNLMFNWPRFNKVDNDLANYCLIPATLPHFLPSAKFIVIVRNPVKMLYSAFWFSCTTYGIRLSPHVQLKGPTLFHHRIEEKLAMFHDCMRDKNDPAISDECSLNDTSYASCITQRLFLLDECVHRIYFNIFGSDLPKCGRSRVAMGIYFAHIRKWLSVVPKERFLFLTLEELIANPVQTATSISRFLGFKQSAADIQKGVELANSACSENSQDSIHYKTSPNLQMRNDTRHMLESFYRPFNTLLADLLQDRKFLWTS
jgi:hypothetical protein